MLTWAACGCVQAAGPLAHADDINMALAAAKPGDTIVIQDGVYRDVAITMAVSGQKDKPITLTAQTPGRVFFTGSAPHQSTAIITMTGQYLHLTGVVFQQSTGGIAVWFKNAQFSRMSDCAFNESGESRTVFGHMIEVGVDSADNEVDHCYMAKSLSMSIGTRAGALRPRFHHNWWRDIVARSNNGQEPLQLQVGREGLVADADFVNTPAASLFALVEYNLFDGACGDEEIISVKSNDNVIRHNTFLPHPTANKGGINVRHGHRNVVDSNFLFGTDYGVRVSGDDNVVINNYIEKPTHGLRLTGGGTNGWAYIPCRNGLFANNTIVDCNYAPLEIGTYFGMKDPKGGPDVVSIYPSGNRIYNNILTTGRPELVVSLIPEQGVGSNELKNNVGFSNRAKKIEDIKVPAGVSCADPNLAKADGHLKPQTGSPAIGQGIAVEGVKEDIYGRPRTGKIDVGCEQVSSNAPAKYHPMTLQEVGPQWMKGDYTVLEKDAGVMELQELLTKYPDPEYRQRLRATLDSVKQ